MTSSASRGVRLAHRLMRWSARARFAEPELLGLAAIVRPGAVVFDVGAAYGMYTFPLADLVGATGRVFSFEPQRRQTRMLNLLKRLTRATQVTLTRSVLGADLDEHTVLVPVRFGIPIYGHAHVAEGTELALAPQSRHMRRSATPMHTVDSWCEREAVDSVSFLKVDVEGFEPVVLAGAAKTIAKSLPSMLLEIEDRHLGRYGRDANQFADELRATWPEYRMYTWSKQGWRETERVTLATRNYLFATDAAFGAGGRP